MATRLARKPWSPSPWQVGESRTTQARTSRGARASTASDVAARTEVGEPSIVGLSRSVITRPVLAVGLDAVSEMFEGRRAYARKRQAVITANAELRERELIKLASLSAALAGTLRRRGVPEPAASLTAEAGIAVFKVGFERWLEDSEERGMAPVMRELLDELKAVAGGGPGS
ncbi:TetR family transcriptional regulator [[Kitasatospora] papulosa]|uniref:acyl-CoA-like ligand-binding transcription factor n=1 Tax=Streptomyces TaxID=1883 RepID=UPI00368C615C